MKELRYSPNLKKLLQFILLLAIVCFNFSPLSTHLAHATAVPPANDAWQNAIALTSASVPYSVTVDTTGANIEPDEPDSLTCDGRIIRGGKATIWYTYTPGASELISLDTLGSTQSVIIPNSNPPKPYPYDTYIAVWTGDPSNNPTLVACGDDNDAGFQSQLGLNVNGGTTYYIQVAQFYGLAGTVTDPGYTGGDLHFHVGYGSQTEIYIAGAQQGGTSYTVLQQSSTRTSYAVNSGPVKAISTNAVPFLIAERDAWLENGVVQSFSEMMGLPSNQLTDTYYFPWYNNVTMDTQLRFANLGNTSTNIPVTIAGVAQPVIPLAAGVSTRVSYLVNNGPVKVKRNRSSAILVAERDAWLVNGAFQSFSEMMGLPGNQLAATYYFPWYNNVTMDTQRWLERRVGKER